MVSTKDKSDQELIVKPSAYETCQPNMLCYDELYSSFDWQTAQNELDGLPGGGLNIAYEAVDRHVRAGRQDHVGLRWLAKSGARLDFTYGDLKCETDRFAALLVKLGLEPGDTVFSLLGRVPELYFAAFGALKAGAVFCPLFSAFGPEPVQSRMTIGKARVLVTTAQYYRRKVMPWREDLPSLRFVFIIDANDAPPEGTFDLADMLAGTASDFEIVKTQQDDPALLHFTSGTTGKPKGAVHVHEAVVAHLATARYALDLHPDDIYWCTADPGWVTGTSYGIVAPLASGVTMIVDEAEFEAKRWYDTLEREGVTVWYTAPTAIRMLMKAGADLAQGRDLSSLRFMASVGEPLNPDAVLWSQRVFGRPFHDNWWQTETGGIMIANYAAMDVKPGSMGKPLPGIEAAIVDHMEADGVSIIKTPMAVGELALRAGWPSMFRGYLGEKARYEACFNEGWYLSGDLAMRDADGYFWFVGRADDVIKSAGHLIGPFEVENALVDHPAVAEAAAIGIPDERAGEVVKAFVALKSGHEASEKLRREILGHARKRLGPAVAPRSIVFAEDLPKTRSGKIMRRLLKARELGLPEGDTSTLERMTA